jgi:hypothetical protein
LGVQSAGWLDIRFTVGTSCERAAPLGEKHATARHHVLRSPISLNSEHRGFGEEYKLWSASLFSFLEYFATCPWEKVQHKVIASSSKHGHSNCKTVLYP